MADKFQSRILGSCEYMKEYAGVYAKEFTPTLKFLATSSRLLVGLLDHAYGSSYPSWGCLVPLCAPWRAGTLFWVLVAMYVCFHNLNF